MTDIVDRLRFLSTMIQNSERLVWGSDSAAMDKAATEIERLRAEVRQARMEGMQAARAVVVARHMGDNNREDLEVLRCISAIDAIITTEERASGEGEP